MAKVSPLEAAQRGMNLLRFFRDGNHVCIEDRDEPAPRAGCNCWVCRMKREANNIVDLYDGEDV